MKIAPKFRLDNGGDGMPTYYEILEIQSDASFQDITRSFRKLALRWHPDKNPDNVEEAEAKFKLIGEAYETLRDPKRRRAYDRHLENLEREQAYDHHSTRSRRRRHRDQDHEDRPPEPEWQRHETDREAVEQLLKLATTLMEEYLKEQQRRKELGKQLVRAVKEKNYDVLPDLIQDGAFLDELSEEGYASIHYAIINNNPNLLAYLMTAGANINAKSADGKIALHFAVRLNSYDLCRALVLTYNSQTHQQDNHNKDTPLHYAIENQCDQRIQELLIRNRSTYTWFFSQYSALDCQDLLKDTPLHLAIKTRQFETIRLLIIRGAKTDLKNRDNNTAIDLMREIYYELPTNISAWLDRELIIQQRARNESKCLVM